MGPLGETWVDGRAHGMATCREKTRGGSKEESLRMGLPLCAADMLVRADIRRQRGRYLRSQVYEAANRTSGTSKDHARRRLDRLGLPRVDTGPADVRREARSTSQVPARCFAWRSVGQAKGARVRIESLPWFDQHNGTVVVDMKRLA
jgi:hypothetical protein